MLDVAALKRLELIVISSNEDPASKISLLRKLFDQEAIAEFVEAGKVGAEDANL